LSAPGLDCAAVGDPKEAKRLLSQEHFDVLVVDIATCEEDRLDLLEYVRNVSSDSKVILVSSVSIPREIARAFALGAIDYVQKPFTDEDLFRAISRAASLPATDREPPSHWSELRLDSQRKQAALEGIHALVCAVEAKDPYTRMHGEQVAHYSSHLARRLDLPAELIESISLAALVHDVGKIGVPDNILTKPGRLSDQEMARIRMHPGLGEYIIQNLSLFDMEATIIRHHHENWDGSGYPDGLSAEEIPLGSRVIRITDAMDAMLMQRSYKSAYPVDTMLDELKRCAETDFDPVIAGAAIEWTRLHPQELILVSPTGVPAVTESA
jgi:putative two-component system response regulator